MSDQANGGEGYFRVSPSKMLESIDRKLDDLTRVMREKHDDHDGRIRDLEARIPRDNEVVGRFLQLEKDFGGFERRLALHEQAPAHPETLSDLASLRTDVDHLKTRESIQDAIEKFVAGAIERSASQRRWMIGLTATMGIALMADIARFMHWFP